MTENLSCLARASEGGRMDMENKSGSWRGGFRVFKLRVSSENLPKLRQLFQDFVDGCARVKGALTGGSGSKSGRTC